MKEYIIVIILILIFFMFLEMVDYIPSNWKKEADVNNDNNDNEENFTDGQQSQESQESQDIYIKSCQNSTLGCSHTYRAPRRCKSNESTPKKL